PPSSTPFPYTTLFRSNHPNILRILDAGFHAGIPYLVTEFAPGGSLRDRLDQQAGKPLPLDEALTILEHIGQALHMAHQQGIVHRSEEHTSELQSRFDL